MLIGILNTLFSASGLFTGASECYAKSDIVTAEATMHVKSIAPQKANDSISSSLNNLMQTLKAESLKKTTITLSAGEEGQTDKDSRDLDGENFKFYAEKSIKFTSSNYAEIGNALKIASKYGFQLNKRPRYEYSKTDSLNAVCIEAATNKAIERAKSAQRALNSKEMKVLKISDSPNFSFYTSDDTMDEDDKIDGFFLDHKSTALGAGGMGRNPDTFYTIVPQQIKVSATIKILVHFD